MQEGLAGGGESIDLQKNFIYSRDLIFNANAGMNLPQEAFKVLQLRGIEANSSANV